ncbi:MAG TPA: crossover junction endodeoxyribonuclease RuvC [Actinomycetota bacterium]|nr:crossover junction endodeoxyribonuclease RuvC [Actinomycetota bacterium]
MRVENGPLRVLGIDPGLTRMGYGVVQERRGQLEALTCGTLRTSLTQDTSTRLLMLFEQLRLVLIEWRPEVVACERIFFAANAASAVPAIQASGIALLLSAQSGLEVREYTPLQVKQAVVGNGAASKRQVQYMVDQLLGGLTAPDSADAADALAVAITHLSSRRLAALAVVR